MSYRNSLSVLIHKRTGDLLIQTMGIHGKLGLPTPDSPQILSPRVKAKKEAWPMIRKFLGEDPAIVSSRSGGTIDKKIERKFRKENYSIGVDLTESGNVELTAMHPYRHGGYVGEHDECVRVPFNAPARAFWEALEKVIQQLA
jgi:hypothetical protein